jgi:hypothetical protein
MIPVLINGKKHNIPTRWDDVTWGQYKKLSECKDGTDLMCIVLGMDKKTLLAATEIEGLIMVQEAIKFMNDNPKIDEYDFILELAGKQVHTASDLTQVKIAQYLDMMLISNQEDNAMESITKVTGIYIIPHFFDEYDFSKLEKTIEVVEALPCNKVLALNAFFFKNLRELNNGTKKHASLPSTAKMKLWQALKHWKVTVSLMPYRIYVKVLTWIGIKSYIHAP